MLSRVSSPYIIQLWQGMQSQDSVFNVLTLCSGNTVKDLIKSQGFVVEETCKLWMQQAIEALTELNMFSYLPRVISNDCFRLLENNLCLDIAGSSRNMQLYVGQPPNLYTTESPEQLQFGVSSSPDLSNDVWSVGVCMYELLFGGLPWTPQSDPSSHLSFVVNHSGTNLPFPVNTKVSNEAKVLLQQMINPNKQQRLLWTSLMNHNYFKNVDFLTPRQSVKPGDKFGFES